MKRFSYRALSPSGQVVSGTIEALDAADGRRQMDSLHLVLIEMSPVSERLTSASSKLGGLIQLLFASSPEPRDIILFIQNLGAMLASSVRLDHALDLLAEPEMAGSLSGQIRAIRSSIMAGDSLYGALTQFPEEFPRGMQAMIMMAEQSGTLPVVLASIAAEREKSLRLKQKIVDALTYPAFLLVAVFCVLVFFIGFVLPQFSAVLTDMGAKADPNLLALLHASAYLAGHRRESLIGLAFLTTLVLVLLRTDKHRAVWMENLKRLPLLRSIDDDYRTAVFCRNFGNLIGHGVSLTEAIDLVGQSVARSGTRQLWESAREEVRQGRRVFDALGDIGDLSTVALRMLRIGEETGQMSALASRAADIFEARVERRIEKTIGIMGPAAIIAVSVMIGGLIVSVMSALMSVNQLVG